MRAGRSGNRRSGGAVNVSEWSCAMVEEWLEGLGLGQLSDRFGDEAVDGEVLLELQDQDLLMLGVSRLGDRKKLMKHIRLLSSALPDHSSHGRSLSSGTPDKLSERMNLRGRGGDSDSSGERRWPGQDLNGDGRSTPPSPSCDPRHMGRNLNGGSANGAATPDLRGDPRREAATSRHSRHEPGGAGTADGGKGKGASKGVAGGDDQKTGNHTSGDNPLALGHRWGTATRTDGPWNGPDMRAKKRSLWSDPDAGPPG